MQVQIVKKKMDQLDTSMCHRIYNLCEVDFE